MKKTTWILSVLAAGVVAFSGAGCKKESAARQPQTIQDGVAQLRQVLNTANAQVQSNLYSGVVYAIRYGRYMDALVSLDQIVNDPSLNDTQKKAVSNTIDLVKQAMTQAPAAPGK